MANFADSVRRAIRPSNAGALAADAEREVAPTRRAATEVRPAVAIAEHDPLLAYLQATPGPFDPSTLELESPAISELRAAGVRLVVPLITSGELVGTVNLGPRRSEQVYSVEDRRLLETLAAQAAPSLRVAQLVRQQQAEARERQRIEQELQVAQLIQQNFLPSVLPQPPGWGVEAYYQPAREVGGDFYDVVTRPDGLVAFAIGDVTDKGVPAAMVMAATRSLLRASGGRLGNPGEVLARVNDLLQPDIPARMFVTCLYGILDPVTGSVRIANAGHNLPFLRSADGTVVELKARGMPLGLMTGMAYEELDATMTPGDELVLHSDGIAEAHDQSGEMFGLPRLRDAVGGPDRAATDPPDRRDTDVGGADGVDASGATSARSAGPIERVLADLRSFTRPGWEQEDDITLLTLRWTQAARRGTVLTRFSLPSEPGGEREAMRRVVESLEGLELDPGRLERLATAVAEAAMNAIEHGNGSDPSKAVRIAVIDWGVELTVAVTDEGGDAPIVAAALPDLEAKLRGEQSSRGWGLFLIEHMVDATRTYASDGRHTLELVLRRTEASRE